MVQSCSYPRGGFGVVVDEEGPAVGRYPHLPARREEALSNFMLWFRGVVRGGLWRLGVGEGVLHCPAHRGVLHTLQGKRESHPSRGTQHCDMSQTWVLSKELCIPHGIDTRTKGINTRIKELILGLSAGPGFLGLP